MCCELHNRHVYLGVNISISISHVFIAPPPPPLSSKVPMFGLEAIFRNGVPVGHLRRSDYGFFIDKTIGYGYIRNPDGGVVSHTPTHPSPLIHPPLTPHSPSTHHPTPPLLQFI